MEGKFNLEVKHPPELTQEISKFDTISDAQTIPGYAAKDSTIQHEILNAVTTYASGEKLTEFVDKAPSSSVFQSAKNAWNSTGIKNPRLGDNSMVNLLKEKGIITESKGDNVSPENSKMHYVQPSQYIQGMTTELLRSANVKVFLANALGLDNSKTIATTYTIPGSVENHIVTIYIKNGFIHYCDPKGVTAPAELSNALRTLAHEKNLGYQENRKAYQQDTVHCGYYSVAILEQLHHGAEPMLGVGKDWIQKVVTAWKKSTPKIPATEAAAPPDDAAWDETP